MLNRSFAQHKFLAALLAFAPSCHAFACPLRDVPSHLTQPDGAIVPCLLSGDEFYNYAHDSRGFVIVQDGVSGQWVYARKAGGVLVPTEFVAGRADPVAAGLTPRITPDPATLERERASKRRGGQTPRIRHLGTMNTLVVFVRFADDAEFPENTSLYDALLNGPAGTVSMRNYFAEASYGKFSVTSRFATGVAGGAIASYQDSHPRGYFTPYNASANPEGYQDADRMVRESALLTAAVNSVASTVPAGVTLDSDGDGVLDHVTFVLRGDSGLWSNILWPHYSPEGIGAARVGNLAGGGYDVQMENVLLPGNVGAICHEFFHALGAPDLYHYFSDGMDPVGKWDLMGYPLRTPQHMGAFMKWKYAGWLDGIPEIVVSGQYTIRPLTSPSGCCWKVISPYLANEYFVLEYRRAEGTFETSLPGTGLLIYRVRPTTGTQAIGNSIGPPDEVYIYRPGGTNIANGVLGQAAYSADSGRVAINYSTDPRPFLDNGAAGGLDVSNIGPTGETMSFTVYISPTLYHLAFTTQPIDGLPRVPLAPAPTVSLLSLHNLPAAVNGPAIQMSLDAGTQSVNLTGTTSAALANGIARFPDLAVDGPGVGLMLRAAYPLLSDGLSLPFSSTQNGVSTTVRVNVSSGAGSQTHGRASAAVPDPSGRLVAFVDSGDNLTSNPAWGSPQDNVFVRDTVTGLTKCASLDGYGNLARAACTQPSMSADGQYVAFTSVAPDMVPGSVTGIHIYLRDMVSGRTSLIDRAPDSTPGNGMAGSAAISADGRYVAFVSTATNLIAASTNSQRAIFVCDTSTNNVVCASVSSGGSAANGDSDFPSISGDGRYVAFSSAASNLVPGQKAVQIYVRDLVAGATVCGSRGPDNAGANASCTRPSISSDGRFVAFESYATNFVEGVPRNRREVYVADVQTGNVVCASVEAGGSPCWFDATAPSLSGDGNRVAFLTMTALAPGTGKWTDAYVRDLQLGRTVLASRRPSGTPASSSTSQCVLSKDGRWAAFVTTADNLVAGDTNKVTDVFLHGPLSFGTYTVLDAVSALRIAGGLSVATSDDTARLKPGGIAGPVDIGDALAIMRDIGGW